MARRKDRASAVVEFFQTASLETAQTVLGICKNVVTQRQPAKTKPRVVRSTATKDTILDDEARAARN